jgi:hypothetical protein
LQNFASLENPPLKDIFGVCESGADEHHSLILKLGKFTTSDKKLGLFNDIK